uniref:FH1/FH2 domain-containing protein 3-like n=1 Tax=Sinocyclocheilus grahami TaxID=75366 RepID=A0A672JUR9_SINGR
MYVSLSLSLEKLYNSSGRDLRRALFSLKQIFQDDKDLVHEFVMAEGLTCLIKVGAEADQNYQNYILRALGQIMLYVDGMNGVIGHTEIIQWLYLLIGSKFRLVVKTSLKLLLVFVEYSESNAPLLIQAINTVDSKRGCKQWSNAMEILAEKDGVDTELLVYVMTLINKTLAALPDQDSFYDMVDVLEEQAMESVCGRYLGRKGTDLDLLEQLSVYEDKERDAKEKAEDSSQDATPREENDAMNEEDIKVANQSNVRSFAERFGDIVKGLTSPPIETQEPPPPPPPAPKKESDCIWDQLMANPRDLRIGDIDFTDLGDEDDQDVLDSGSLYSSGDLQAPPPPPPPSPLFQKRKKTIRLFWSEVRPADWIYRNHKRSQESLWSRLEPVKLDTAKLEHLFESKSKEMPKTAADGKRQEIIILDSKRSNSINIGLTVLPPPRTIKTAIMNFDEYALNKEGIEKILTMIPTEEETQKIQEAQLANPDIPLGSAEQFLLTLSSISELSARLQLWAFKLDYEATEKEVAEPLQDLKEGMDQLEKNRTLRFIFSTLLAIGNFLNGSSAKGFDLTYLEKVPEVKDTVHKQSLLHHVCSIVVENFPDSTDLYSEIGAVTRSAKVDFGQLQETLTQMEWRCKASWDHLKVIAKHEMKPALKQKMSDFLKDCAERIIILKTVHRRIMNRFHWFLLFLGQPAYSAREVSVTRFSKLLSEFALEYRTTRERVLQQRQKRADHRERNKTRGKMITDLSTQVRYAHLHTILISQCATDDAADEIMERIVQSATQSPRERGQPRERRRSRVNRKSRTFSCRVCLFTF